MNQCNTKQFSLRIDAVANGYMVRTALDTNIDRSYALIDDTKVAYLPIYPVGPAWSTVTITADAPTRKSRNK